MKIILIYENAQRILTEKIYFFEKLNSNFIQLGKKASMGKYDWNSTFGAVEKVQKYLNDNQMRKYIPIKYTWDKNHPNYEPPIKRSRSS